jgi:hypothetical protein
MRRAVKGLLRGDGAKVEAMSDRGPNGEPAAPQLRGPGRAKPLLKAADIHMGRTMAKARSEASFDGVDGRQVGKSFTKS